MGWGLTFSLGRIVAVGGVHPLSMMIALTLVAPRKSQPLGAAQPRIMPSADRE